MARLHQEVADPAGGQQPPVDLVGPEPVTAGEVGVRFGVRVEAEHGRAVAQDGEPELGVEEGHPGGHRPVGLGDHLLELPPRHIPGQRAVNMVIHQRDRLDRPLQGLTPTRGSHRLHPFPSRSPGPAAVPGFRTCPRPRPPTHRQVTGIRYGMPEAFPGPPSPGPAPPEDPVRRSHESVKGVRLPRPMSALFTSRLPGSGRSPRSAPSTPATGSPPTA